MAGRVQLQGSGFERAPRNLASGDRGRHQEGRVRPMTPEDVATVVDIHVAAFPGYFLTSLGPRFLALYYAHVVSAKLGIGLVFDCDGRVLGFAVGELNPGRFYRELFWRRCLAFGFYALKAAAKQPSILLRMTRQVFQRVEAPTSDDVARLAALAVAPEEQEHGYGRVLVAAFIERVSDRGGKTIFLEARKENQSVLQFYVQMGFKVVREVVQAPGEVLVELRYAVRKEASR